LVVAVSDGAVEDLDSHVEIVCAEEDAALDDGIVAVLFRTGFERLPSAYVRDLACEGFDVVGVSGDVWRPLPQVAARPGGGLRVCTGAE
jgi:hypothetical protein